MAHFYGTLQGGRGEATRLGHVNSGIETVAASWEGAIRVRLYIKDGEDWADVQMCTWRGHGENATLYRGPVGKYAPVKDE